MNVRQQVSEKKFLRKFYSSTDVFVEVAKEYAKRNGLDWIIKDKGEGLDRTITVKVDLASGSYVELELDPYAPVKEMKLTLQKGIGITAANICLMWDGKVLEDEKPVHLYEVNIEGRLKLIEKKDVEFSVKTPDKQLIPLKMCRTSTVRDVMETILRRNKAEEKNLHLYHNSVMLCQANLLMDYKIGSARDILVLAPGHGIITIALRSLTGWCMRLDVDANEWVADVKKKVENFNKDMPVDQQILIFNQVTLHDDQPLSRYNIQNEDEVYIRLQLRGGEPVVHVLTSKGEYIPFPVYKFDSVQYVRQRVADQFGIPMEAQELVIHRDEILGGNHTPKQRAHRCCVM